ncbi:hypothetical protein LTR62_005107 [Meristemomyces frigidus]|uniref:Mucin n=1 Tax=Meristemomyces frigidus TaxID=1508187 RepID=A0AAN7TR61_9PEZI|nr:hypothetical protein LTR62_005107 [Meristemomyces frigidus]
MVSAEEYSKLPPSIQRKFFTSAERISIAQAAADHRRKHSRKRTWLSPRPSLDFHNYISSASPRSRTPSDASTDKHSLGELRSGERPITPEQAAWFLSLPEKVRKQHFSKEERARSEECAKVLNSASRAPLTSSLLASSANASDQECHDRPALSREAEITISRIDTQEPPHLSQPRCTDDTICRPLPVISAAEDDGTQQDAQVGPASTGDPAEAKVFQEVRCFNRAILLKPIRLPPPRLAPLPASPLPEYVEPTVVLALDKLSWRLSRPCDDFYVPSPVEKDELESFEPFLSAAPTRSPTREELAVTWPQSDNNNSNHTPQELPTTLSDSFPLDVSSPVPSHGHDDNDSLQTDGPSTPSAMSSTSSQQAMAELTLAQPSAPSDNGLNHDIVAHDPDLRFGFEHDTRTTSTQSLAMLPAAMRRPEGPDDWSRARGAVAIWDALTLEPLLAEEHERGHEGVAVIGDATDNNDDGAETSKKRRLTKVWRSIRRQH